MKKQPDHRVARKKNTNALPACDSSSRHVSGNDQFQEAPRHSGAAPSTIDEIWIRLSKRLGRFIRRQGADSTTAEDIMQDVFVKLQERPHDIQDPQKIDGWIFRVARNAVIDFHRKTRLASKRPALLSVEPPLNDAFEMDELHSKLRQILARLSEEDRQAVLLTTLEGLSQEAFAAHLGISLSAAKSRIQRARERLKELLLDFCQREIDHTGCSPCPRGLFPMVKTKKPQKKRCPQESK